MSQIKMKKQDVDKMPHYNGYDKEVIDMMIDIFGKEETAIFCKINAFKYRMRLGLKGGPEKIPEDLAKEQWYIDKAHELKK